MEINDEVSGSILIYDKLLYTLLKYVDETNMHNAIKSASDWDWSINNDLRQISSFENFQDRNETDRLILFKNEDYKTKDGEEINILNPMYGKITWCNVFARDLSYKYLFPSLFSKTINPWGIWDDYSRASDIQDKILNSSDFKSVTFDEAWAYTNKGYVVYLTSYNYRYIRGTSNSKHPGHIATCFPTPDYVPGNYKTGKVIQAGSSWGVLNFGVNVWTDGRYGKDKEGVVFSNLYLGYILKE